MGGTAAIVTIRGPPVRSGTVEALPCPRVSFPSPLVMHHPGIVPASALASGDWW